MTIWQTMLSQAVTDLAELASLLELDPGVLQAGLGASQQFALRVPRGFIARMQKKNYRDPLLLQVLPQPIEMQLTPGFETDPVTEKHVNPVPGLLHKYHGRVLLTVAGACAINCRYCFRRHFPYADNVTGSKWTEALRYIANDTTIHEVILSGGDPLVVKDELLQQLVTALEQIEHVKRLRIHTRLPIVIPERITAKLVTLLSTTRLQTVVVIHCNHAQEIDVSVTQALSKLTAVNIPLLNQSVLLKGINDQAATLIALSETLFAAGVLPYYLHVLDKVQGGAHFLVDDKKAIALATALMQQLPGYLVPKLVREEAGARSKSLLKI